MFSWQVYYLMCSSQKSRTPSIFIILFSKKKVVTERSSNLFLGCSDSDNMEMVLKVCLSHLKTCWDKDNWNEGKKTFPSTQLLLLSSRHIIIKQQSSSSLSIYGKKTKKTLFRHFHTQPFVCLCILYTKQSQL